MAARAIAASMAAALMALALLAWTQESPTVLSGSQAVESGLYTHAAASRLAALQEQVESDGVLSAPARDSVMLARQRTDMMRRLNATTRPRLPRARRPDMCLLWRPALPHRCERCEGRATPARLR